MKFEWDENKNRFNLEKHGVDFVDAIKIFADVYYVYESKNAGTDAKRFVAVGVLDGRFLAIIHTKRLGSIRIISVRKARYEEREKYCKLYA